MKVVALNGRPRIKGKTDKPCTACSQCFKANKLAWLLKKLHS